MVVKLLEHPTALTLAHIKVKEIENLNNIKDIVKAMEGDLTVDVLKDYIPAVREIIQDNLLKIDYFEFENLPLYLTIEAA